MMTNKLATAILSAKSPWAVRAEKEIKFSSYSFKIFNFVQIHILAFENVYNSFSKNK